MGRHFAMILIGLPLLDLSWKKACFMAMVGCDSKIVNCNGGARGGLLLSFLSDRRSTSGMESLVSRTLSGELFYKLSCFSTEYSVDIIE